jgi:tetraacyldisaccharide 4'-kinase
VLASEFWNELLHCPPAGLPNDVRNKQQFHARQPIDPARSGKLFCGDALLALGGGDWQIGPEMRERFRAWSENLETFWQEVTAEERSGARAGITRAFLYVCSKLFQVGIKTRRFLYNVRILRDSTLGVQVIAIGNLTLGGTGKTPVVEKFARELRDQGRTVAILSRGYRSKPTPMHIRLLNKLLLRNDTTPPRVVSDGRSLLLDSEMAGDEPYMLASNLKDVVVLVDKDRVKSGRYAIEKFGCDTLLLDDGFQYWKLRGRRQDIVLIDRQQPFGNEWLFPRGSLRESPWQLARASYVFITKSDGNTDELRRRISQFNPTAGVIECIHHPLYLEDVFTARRFELDTLTGHKVAALSGIAQPESFEQSLTRLGAELVYAKRFADHHRFTQQEILNVINRSKKRQAEAIITTQKDAVRFPKIDRRDLPIYFMRVEIKILSGAKDFQDCVRKICFR